MISIEGYMVKGEYRYIYKLMRATPDDDFSFLDDIKEGTLYWNYMYSEVNEGLYSGLHLKYERAFILKYDEEQIIREPICPD